VSTAHLLKKDRRSIAIGGPAKYIVGIVGINVTPKQILNTNTNRLPQPDAVSLAHSERVRRHIKRIIVDAGGSIAFAEFMQHALYANGLGYYSAGANKFGETGDFVTAPEISPLFGKILANQVCTVLEQIPDVALRSILEIGAGSGALAVDLLQQLEALNSLPSRYFILDVSPDLQQRQLAAIESAMPHFVDKVEWLSGWPENLCGAIVANEVLDAMPVERFVKCDGQVVRQTVTATDDGFAWASMPAPDILTDAVNAIEADIGQEFPDGYESEVSLGAAQWLSDLANSLQIGFVFLFDYGVSQREYYASDRCNGWLRCHFRHHAHSDPLIYPGIQDLTAWVDFTRVANAAYDSGLQIAGYVNQGQFLLQGGLMRELEDIARMPTDAQIALSQQVKLLTMPGEMGENFKCLGLSKGAIDAPELFSLSDRSHTL